jgi:hypothetical protein
MIPLALMLITLGWFDVPPRTIAAPSCPVRELSNRERRRITGNWK